MVAQQTALPVEVFAWGGESRIPSRDRLSPLHPRVLPKAGAHRGTDEMPAL